MVTQSFYNRLQNRFANIDLPTSICQRRFANFLKVGKSGFNDDNEIWQLPKSYQISVTKSVLANQCYQIDATKSIIIQHNFFCGYFLNL